jgi:transposase
MRADGRVLREIAETLNVSITTAARWSDPEYEARARERSRQAKLARRMPCERCSRPLSYDRVGGVCSQCQREHSRQRIAEIAGLYEAGHEPSAIAGRVGLAEGHVRNLISELARTGAVVPRYAPRDRAAVRDREQQILALRANGATHAEMAEAVGLAAASVNQTLVRLRSRRDALGSAAA